MAGDVKTQFDNKYLDENLLCGVGMTQLRPPMNHGRIVMAQVADKKFVDHFTIPPTKGELEITDKNHLIVDSCEMCVGCFGPQAYPEDCQYVVKIKTRVLDLPPQESMTCPSAPTYEATAKNVDELPPACKFSYLSTTIVCLFGLFRFLNVLLSDEEQYGDINKSELINT